MLLRLQAQALLEVWLELVFVEGKKGSVASSFKEEVELNFVSLGCSLLRFGCSLARQFRFRNRRLLLGYEFSLSCASSFSDRFLDFYIFLGRFWRYSYLPR